MLDILARQVASPVQFVKGLHTLYDAGARVFVEVGPKQALQGFADDVLGDARTSLARSPTIRRRGDIVSFNQALCGLYAAGLGRGRAARGADPRSGPAGGSRAVAPRRRTGAERRASGPIPAATRPAVRRVPRAGGGCPGSAPAAIRSRS